MRPNSLERLHTRICTYFCMQLAAAETERWMSCKEACLLCSSCLKTTHACVWTALLACYHTLDQWHYSVWKLPSFFFFFLINESTHWCQPHTISYQLCTTQHGTQSSSTCMLCFSEAGQPWGAGPRTPNHPYVQSSDSSVFCSKTKWLN